MQEVNLILLHTICNIKTEGQSMSEVKIKQDDIKMNVYFHVWGNLSISH